LASGKKADTNLLAQTAPRGQSRPSWRL